MKNCRAGSWLAAVMLIFSGPAVAGRINSLPGISGKPFGFMVQTDLDFGGDELATVNFTNGKSQDVRAGQGLVVSAGFHGRPSESTPFDVQALIGYKYVTTAARNADITVTRVVLQLLGDYRFDNGVYLGGGLVRHTGTKLDGDGFFQNVKFDDATGYTLEAGWGWVGLHYTHIEYRHPFFSTVDASHVGLRLSFRF